MFILTGCLLKHYHLQYTSSWLLNHLCFTVTPSIRHMQITLFWFPRFYRLHTELDGRNIFNEDIIWFCFMMQRNQSGTGTETSSLTVGFYSIKKLKIGEKRYQWLYAIGTTMLNFQSKHHNGKLALWLLGGDQLLLTGNSWVYMREDMHGTVN